MKFPKASLERNTINVEFEVGKQNEYCTNNKNLEAKKIPMGISSRESIESEEGIFFQRYLQPGTNSGQQTKPRENLKFTPHFPISSNSFKKSNRRYTSSSSSSKKQISFVDHSISIISKDSCPKTRQEIYRPIIQVGPSTKIKSISLPRLKFGLENINCENIDRNHQDKQEKLVELLKNLSDPLILNLNELEATSSALIALILEKSSKMMPYSKQRSQRDKFWRGKRKELQENRHVWYTYWKYQTRIDIQKTYQRRIRTIHLKELFPVYLFYVEMILTILPFHQTKPFETSSNDDYCEQIKVEIILFLKLDNPGEDSKNDTLLMEKSSQLIQAIKLGNIGESRTLWSILDLWIQRNHQELWDRGNYAQGKFLRADLKILFDYIFCCSIENLNRYYNNLIS
jgi:hypothetical protein